MSKTPCCLQSKKTKVSGKCFRIGMTIKQYATEQMNERACHVFSEFGGEKALKQVIKTPDGAE